MKTVVIIATKGRPQEVSNLIEALAQQSVPPDRIIVSACDPGDVARIPAAENVEVVFGAPGSSVQRNKGLSLARGQYDVVVFFDDDFIPSRYWIEHVREFFSTHADAASVTGLVLADGAKSGGLRWSDGQPIVDDADRSAQHVRGDYKLRHGRPAYGCNMAFRATSVEDVAFDERLVLYGWLEDRDFSVRASRNAGMTETSSLWGVHLGTSGARSSGLRFGYSQIVNPWYLATKGSMTRSEAMIMHIARSFLRNGVGMLFPDSTVDRPGRFKGNLIALKDILSGPPTPEKVLELDR